jgi:hypothetical protein
LGGFILSRGGLDTFTLIYFVKCDEIKFWLWTQYSFALDNVKPWWIWGYWVSPLMYVQNAASVNEFLGHSWRHVRSFMFLNSDDRKTHTRTLKTRRKCFS